MAIIELEEVPAAKQATMFSRMLDDPNLENKALTNFRRPESWTHYNDVIKYLAKAEDDDNDDIEDEKCEPDDDEDDDSD